MTDIATAAAPATAPGYSNRQNAIRAARKAAQAKGVASPLTDVHFVITHDGSAFGFELVDQDEGKAAAEPRSISDERLAEIQAIPDSAIDTSDIPEGTPEWFERARKVPGPTINLASPPAPKGGTDGLVDAIDMAGNPTRVAADNPLLFDGRLFPNKSRLSAYKARPAPPSFGEVVHALHPKKAAKAKSATPLGDRREKAKASVKGKRAARAEKAAKPAKIAGAPAAGSKTETALALLAKGTTIAAIVEATGWLPHTTRAFVSTLPAKRGMTLAKEKVDGTLVYTATPKAGA